MVTADIETTKWGLQFLAAGASSEVYTLPAFPNIAIKLSARGELQSSIDKMVRLYETILALRPPHHKMVNMICPTTGIFLHSSFGVKANIERLPCTKGQQYQEWPTKQPYYYNYPGAEPNEIPILQDVIIQPIIQATPFREIRTPRDHAVKLAAQVFQYPEWWEDVIENYGLEAAERLNKAWLQCRLDGHRGNIGWDSITKRPVVIDL